MNQFVIKIIGGLIGGIVLISLISYSFLSGKQKDISLPDFLHQNFFVEEFSGTGASYKNVDMFSHIYYTSGSEPIVTQEEDQYTIKVQTGSYLFYFKNPFQKIVIEQDGLYDIILENGGMVYLEDSKVKSMIASLNGIARTEFKNQNTGEVQMKTYLYPHMYLGFMKRRFQGRKDLDSLRVSQLGKLGYFRESFDEMLSSKDVAFIGKRDFLLPVLSHIKDSQQNLSLQYTKARDIEVYSFGNISYIKKYFLWFYNTNKKLVYYKNNIMSNIIVLVQKEGDKKKVIEHIFSDLKEIEALDAGEYNKMIDIFNAFYILALSHVDGEGKSDHMSFYKVGEKLFHKRISQNILELNEAVERLNFSEQKGFYEVLGRQAQSGTNFGTDEGVQDYYLYFIERILLSGFKEENLEMKYFYSLIDLYDSYSSYFTQQEYGEAQDKKILTYITNNEKVLSSIKIAIHQRFFYQKRDAQGLLVLKGISFDKRGILENTVKNIVNFSLKGKALMEQNMSKYNITLTFYETIEQEFKEYFLALKDYNLYKKDYSKVNKKLLNTQVFDDSDESLSVEKFREYMSQFNGMNLSSIQVSVVGDTFYKVENIRFGGREFSFELYPFEGNRVFNIHVKNSSFQKGTPEYIFYYNLENITYDLDFEKEKYEKLYNKVSDKEKERYNFKNFFLNKLFPQEKKSGEIFIDHGNSGEGDDDIVSLFKTAKLLGEKGEFRNIASFFHVKYKHLEVQKKSNGNFDILLEKVPVKLRIKQGEKLVQSEAYLDSGYSLEDGQHYFYNISLQPFTRRSSGEVLYTFGDTKLFIEGIIHLPEFKKKLLSTLENISYIKEEYKKYTQKNGSNFDKMVYNINTKELYFE